LSTESSVSWKEALVAQGALLKKSQGGIFTSIMEEGTNVNNQQQQGMRKKTSLAFIIII